jgi:hypothetical protein
VHAPKVTKKPSYFSVLLIFIMEPKGKKALETPEEKRTALLLLNTEWKG